MEHKDPERDDAQSSAIHELGKWLNPEGTSNNATVVYLDIAKHVLCAQLANPRLAEDVLGTDGIDALVETSLEITNRFVDGLWYCA